MTTILANLPPKTLLHHGNYRIEEKIGQGGFGITYRATMLTLQQEVVIKELFFRGHSVRDTGNSTVSIQSLDKSQYEKVKAKFIMEGQTLAQFRHPNIVRVNFIFEENNTVYLVMDYIKGQTLRDYVESHGKLSTTEALSFIHQVCEALQVIHKKQILHRDIKPSNIMITPQKKAILIDFGIAKQFAEDRTVSNTGAHTPGFAPIEQYSGRRKLGPFTDIYSLSATMYFALTGTRPIDATDRLDEELPAPNTLNKKISGRLSALIMKGMSIKTDDRFQTVEEFTAALNNTASNSSKPQNGHTADRTRIEVRRRSKPMGSPPPEEESEYVPSVIKDTPTVVTVQPRSKTPSAPPPPVVNVRTDELHYANPGRRLGAFLLDTIFLFIIGFLFGALVMSSDIFYYEDEALNFITIAGVFIAWLYYARSESSSWQATLGKRIAGVIVTNEQGQRISFWQATGRWISKIFSGLILMIGYLMILWTRKNQGLHDMMSGTVVIKKTKDS